MTQYIVHQNKVIEAELLYNPYPHNNDFLVIQCKYGYEIDGQGRQEVLHCPSEHDWFKDVIGVDNIFDTDVTNYLRIFIRKSLIDSFNFFKFDKQNIAEKMASKWKPKTKPKGMVKFVVHENIVIELDAYIHIRDYQEYAAFKFRKGYEVIECKDDLSITEIPPFDMAWFNHMLGKIVIPDIKEIDSKEGFQTIFVKGKNNKTLGNNQFFITYDFAISKAISWVKYATKVVHKENTTLYDTVKEGDVVINGYGYKYIVKDKMKSGNTDFINIKLINTYSELTIAHRVTKTFFNKNFTIYEQVHSTTQRESELERRPADPIRFAGDFAPITIRHSEHQKGTGSGQIKVCTAALCGTKVMVKSNNHRSSS